jgi:methylthioribulose-1-phosphate dehydratase
VTSHELVGQRLAEEAARMASLGWMRGTAGNLSEVLVHNPLRLVITASGIDKGELTSRDVVEVDATGAPVADSMHRPSAEAGLHCRIALLTGAGAIVHTHPVEAVVASRRFPDGVVVDNLEMLKGIGRAASGERVTIPVIANSQDMVELGDRLEAAWTTAVPAVIVADHGLYAWGSDLRQARHHTEIVQWLLNFTVLSNS